MPVGFPVLFAMSGTVRLWLYKVVKAINTEMMRSVVSDPLSDIGKGIILLLSYRWSRLMPAAEHTTTVVSTKGQVILPKAIRQQRHWTAGTRLVVENTAEGVLLRPAPMFPETRPDEVFAVLAYKGEARSLEEMEAGILAEARRHAGD